MRALIVALLIAAGTAQTAAAAPVFRADVDRPMDTVYPAVKAALEEAKFFVVFEVNIGENLARFKERWGEDYNRRNLSGIRSMVFCNGWYANRVGNADPDMLAVCPLRLTLVAKAGTTRVLFPRPTRLAGDSDAGDVLEEVERAVIGAIRDGTEAARGAGGSP